MCRHNDDSFENFHSRNPSLVRERPGVLHAWQSRPNASEALRCDCIEERLLNRFPRCKGLPSFWLRFYSRGRVRNGLGLLYPDSISPSRENESVFGG